MVWMSDNRNLFTVCEHDNETVVHIEDLVTAYRYEWRSGVEELQVCPQNLSRFYVLTERGEYFLEENTYRTGYGSIIDQHDYEENYFTCEHCGDIFHNEDVILLGSTQEYVCQRCSDSYMESNGSSIHSYDYKPELEFFKLPNETTELFVGTETEIDVKDDDDHVSERARNEVASFFGNNFDGLLYNKHDGSLRHGFEVVSQPMTYNYLLSVRNKIKNGFDFALDKGFASHNTDTCGLHIHISRKAFGGQREISNFVYLFEKFYDEVLKFSRRTLYSMERWAERYGIYNSADSSKSFSDKLENVGRDKYRIVNLRHRATLEVRAFRGTLNFDTYLASVQFMLVMHKLATSKELVVNNVTWRSVVRTAEVMKFAELCDYLKKRGLYDHDTKRFILHKKRQTRILKKGDLLRVVGDCGLCTHHYRVGSIVKVVDICGNNRILSSIVDCKDLESFQEWYPTQFLVYSDLSFENDNLPLSEYDVEVVEEVF